MSLIPILIFHQRNPGALTNRFRDLTYVSADKSIWASFGEFVRRYGEDVNPMRWLFTGGTDPRDHLPGTGSMLAVIVFLGLAGLWLVLRSDRRNSWWIFILYALAVSVVPAALMENEFAQLRLIAFPVLFLVLTIPALAWLIAVPEGRNEPSLSKRVVAGLVLLMMVSQGLYFQWRYHRSVADFWYVFDARFRAKFSRLRWRPITTLSISSMSQESRATSRRFGMAGSRMSNRSVLSGSMRVLQFREAESRLAPKRIAMTAG